MSNCNEKVKTVKLADVAIDTLALLPDYILAERDIEDESTGNVKRTIVRVPAGKLFPNASQDNVIGLEINNPAVTVPEGQVRAGYIANEIGSNIMRYSDTTHAPVFLMLGTYTDNIMRVQNTGFVNIPEGHQYIIGVQYYAGSNGEPVTDASVTGKKLFIAVSRTVLAVNM